jgi:hypothetical protein
MPVAEGALLALVPKGLNDRSQAPSAWESTGRHPSPKGRIPNCGFFPGTGCLATIVCPSGTEDQTIYNLDHDHLHVRHLSLFLDLSSVTNTTR